MPYIPQDERPVLAFAAAYGRQCTAAGHLNFVITQVISGFLGSDPHYHDFNKVIGVLECVKLELYRRMVAPYEDQAKERNGDVYP